MDPFLSVIIPAFNEAHRIQDTITEVVSYLATCSFTSEVLVVDDGSTDETASKIAEMSTLHPSVSLIRMPHNGKGWAVKHGMVTAHGAYRFLCDADLSMPIHQLTRFLPPLEGRYDIAIGSRELVNSNRHGEPVIRHLTGRAFNQIVRILALPHLEDTQCGFKCFRGTVADRLFSLQSLRGFAFDVEVLFMARQHGFRVAEIPIDWYHRPLSKVRPLRDALPMLWDVLRIRWVHRIPHR